MANVEFDISEIKSWTENTKKLLQEETDKFLEEAALLLESEFIRRVQQKTPVGEYGNYVEFTTNPQKKTKEVSFKTKDGKDVFFIAKNSPKVVKFKSATSGMQGGTLRDGWRTKEKKRTKDGYEIIIHNPVSYAPHVEYGHRIMNKKGGEVKGFKRGEFMQKNTEIEMAFVAQELLEESFNTFLKKVLDIE